MAKPPVCRLMDYGKYIYRLAKDKKQKAHQPQLKEVKFRPKIDDHDYGFKLNHIKRFLDHPRWDFSGNLVCIDSTHGNDERQMYVIDVSGLVEAPPPVQK